MVTLMEDQFDITQLGELVPKNKKILFFCIGTPKSKGDAIGPLVGSYLKRNGCKVYGTIKNPITALNIESKITYVKKKYPNHFIIAIDATIWIGTNEQMKDKVLVEKSPIYAGAGVGKKISPIGDLSIKAVTVIAKKGVTNEQIIAALNEKPLEEVIKIKNLIAKECINFISTYKERIKLKDHITNIVKKYKVSF